METTEIIYAVSEAFSMQPLWYWVGEEYGTGSNLAVIKKEAIYDTGDPFDFYVGYDEKGKKVFAMRVQAANVRYK